MRLGDAFPRSCGGVCASLSGALAPSVCPSQPALHLFQKFASGAPRSGASAYTQEGLSCLLPRSAGTAVLAQASWVCSFADRSPPPALCFGVLYAKSFKIGLPLCLSLSLCLPLCFCLPLLLSHFSIIRSSVLRSPSKTASSLFLSSARPVCPASWLFPGLPAPASHSSRYICLLSPGMISERPQIPGFVFFWSVKAALGCSRCVSEVTSPLLSQTVLVLPSEPFLPKSVVLTLWTQGPFETCWVHRWDF